MFRTEELAMRILHGGIAGQIRFEEEKVPMILWHGIVGDPEEFAHLNDRYALGGSDIVIGVPFAGGSQST